MYRRVLAALIAVLMILLTFGCGKGTGDTGASKPAEDTAENGKIAIVLGAYEQSPEVFAAVDAIAKAHPESVTTVKYAENFYDDDTAVTKAVLPVAENENVKAVIFADGVKGTGAAVKAVREKRKDVCIAVCNPHEGSVEMKGANLVLSVDFPALGAAMVKQAKEMGAENFVFYTTNRHLKFASVVALRQAAEKACKTEKLTFKATSCMDLYEEGRTPETAKKHITEDVPRMDAKLGKKTALFCTEPQLQQTLADETVRHGMVMPATFLPAPVKAQTEGDGRIAAWSFSSYTAFLQAAHAYCSGVLNGSGNATTVERVQKLLSGFTDGTEVTVTTDANGAYLVQSALVKQ